MPAHSGTEEIVTAFFRPGHARLCCRGRMASGCRCSACRLILSGAALALEIATAVQHLARQQLDMEVRLGDVAGRQEVMAQYLKGFIQKTEGRLQNLELHLSTGATVSE